MYRTQSSASMAVVVRLWFLLLHFGFKTGFVDVRLFSNAISRVRSIGKPYIIKPQMRFCRLYFSDVFTISSILRNPFPMFLKLSSSS